MKCLSRYVHYTFMEYNTCITWKNFEVEFVPWAIMCRGVYIEILVVKLFYFIQLSILSVLFVADVICAGCQSATAYHYVYVNVIFVVLDRREQVKCLFVFFFFGFLIYQPGKKFVIDIFRREKIQNTSQLITTNKYLYYECFYFFTIFFFFFRYFTIY